MDFELDLEKFAEKMYLRLRQKFEEGQRDWKQSERAYLESLLFKATKQCKWVDVANYAMMLEQSK